MIKLFSGLPGCGKSYRAVYEMYKICNKYYILHNIDGLNEDRIDGGKYIKDFRTLGNFNEIFTLESQKKYADQVKEKYGRQLLIIVDECQQYLEKYNAGIKGWMAYHRHLGQDIWLITHNRFNIDRSYHSLIELEINGKRGFIFNSFIYAYIAQGAKIKTDRIPKKKEIFALYKSFDVVEADKPKSKLFWFIGAMTVLALGMGYYAFGYHMPKQMQKISGQADSLKKSISGNKSHVLPDISEIRNEYSYVGNVGKEVLLSDNYGNVWKASQIYSISDVKIFDDDSVFVVFNDGKSQIMRLKSIPDRREAASGREARSADAVKMIKTMIKIM